ncbi:MAG: O-antigen ligase family protein [Anaerolineales bacterium]
MKALWWELSRHAPEVAFGGLVLAAAFLVALAPLTVATAAIAGALVVVLTLIRPHFALYLLALAVPFGSLREFAVGPISIGGAEAVGILVAGAWVLRVLALREPIRWRAPLTWALLAFLFVGLVSTLGALSLSHSVKELLRWGELLVIFLAAGNLLRGRRIYVAAGFVLLGAALEGLLGLYQFFRQAGPEGFVLLGRFMRAYGTFEQPNPYAGYLGLVFPLALALVLSAPAAWREVIAIRRWRVAAWVGVAVAAALALGGIVASWSRGAWIGLAASTATVILLRGRRWAAALLIAAALAVALLGAGAAANVLPPAIVERFADVGAYFRPFDVRTVEVTDANWAIVERMAHWQAGWAMFGDRPWLGVGFGNYEAVYPAYAIGIWRDPLGHAHNYYINVAAEAGLVGLGAYLAVLVAALVQTGRSARRASGLARALCIGALGMLVHLCVHNVVDNLYVHGMNMLVGMALGMAWAFYDERQTARVSETKP